MTGRSTPPCSCPTEPPPQTQSTQRRHEQSPRTWAYTWTSPRTPSPWMATDPSLWQCHSEWPRQCHCNCLWKRRKKQEKPAIARSIPDMYLLMVWHLPLFVSTGLRNSNKNTVPVGRSLMRFPTPVSVLSFMLLESEELLVLAILGICCFEARTYIYIFVCD